MRAAGSGLSGVSPGRPRRSGWQHEEQRNRGGWNRSLGLPLPCPRPPPGGPGIPLTAAYFSPLPEIVAAGESQSDGGKGGAEPGCWCNSVRSAHPPSPAPRQTWPLATVPGAAVRVPSAFLQRRLAGAAVCGNLLCPRSTRGGNLARVLTWGVENSLICRQLCGLLPSYPSY